MIFNEKLSITATSPFSFELSTQLFRNGDPEIRKYESGKFWQVIRINDKLAHVLVESHGSVDKPRLRVEIKSECKLTDNDKKEGRRIIGRLFNLNFNLTEFYTESKNDKVIASLTRKFCGLKSPTTQFAFEALVDSIVEQQISLKVAHAFEKRIIKKWGDALYLDDEVYYAYPTSKNLAKATQQELRGIGLSERKAEYVKNVASIIAEGKLDLESLACGKTSNEIIEELDKIKGVGVWTAELTMLRGMQRLEALPADDLGLRRTIAHFYCNDKEITSSQARDIAKNWGTWKGLAAYYLIVAEILAVKP